MDTTFPKHIAVLGLGYVGLPLALLAARRGHTVTGIDTNEEKVSAINARRSPILDAKLEEELKDTTLSATTDASAVRDADIIIICVPTPVSHDHEPDLGPVIGAARAIGPHLGDRGQLVVLESTVNPGVCEEVLIPELERISGRIAGKDFHIAHCPERINPGDPAWTVRNIPRVVGSLNEQGLASALEFYRSIVEAEIRPMGSLKEAEAVKIVENSFRDINIAFVNELAMSFSKLGIDVVRVIEGASSKPFAFMPHFPGCGVGGHCIPVDPYYLIKYAYEKNGFTHEFLSLARKINNGMPAYTVDLLLEKLAEKGIAAKGAKIAVLGLAYKAGIDDDRESPAYRMIEHLKEAGVEVAAYDPYVRNGGVKELADALRGANGVIVATAHPEFRALTPEDFIGYDIDTVVDGRNCLDKELFAASAVQYHGIGR